MKKLLIALTLIKNIASFKLIKDLLFPYESFQSGATRLFLQQVNNPYIRKNVQNSESPRDAAIIVVQDALEIAGAGKVVGRIVDIENKLGMFIVKYELFGIIGAISYMPNKLRTGYIPE